MAAASHLNGLPPKADRAFGMKLVAPALILLGVLLAVPTVLTVIYSLHDVPARLEALGALAGLDDRALARQAASGIDLVLHVERGRDGARRLAAVGRPVVDARGRLGIEEVRWSAV